MRLRLVPFPSDTGLPEGCENVSTIPPEEMADLFHKFIDATKKLREPFGLVLRDLLPEEMADMFGADLFKNEMTPLEREMKQYLFEDQQQQLEYNVEKLSMFLQNELQEFSDEQIEEIRMHVINLSRVMDLSCKKMYQCIENELLETLQSTFRHQIAPYKSSGLERAS